MNGALGTAASPLSDLHREAGARFQELRGARVPRHFGDPAAEYRAATEGIAVLDRSQRGRWRVRGRAPSRMLDGLVTCAVPEPVEWTSDEVAAGSGAYGTVLTPKGRIVTDLRLFRAGGAEPEDFLMDLPACGLESLRGHLEKYLPPRFATVDEETGATAMLTVLGPDAVGLLCRDAAGLRVAEEELSALEEGAFVLVGDGPDDGVRIVRTDDVDVPAFDVVADASTARALWERLAEAGARPVGYGAWEALRVERGRPAFGTDMDGDTIPVEAGIHTRAIDYTKGCYTGQEVIVRIRDRGRVNWHLRGFLLGDVPTPSAGSELFEAGEERAVGRITSALHSPRIGQVAGLGYARREVEPPATLRLGDPDGEPVEVRELERGWGDG